MYNSVQASGRIPNLSSGSRGTAGETELQYIEKIKTEIIT